MAVTPDKLVSEYNDISIVRDNYYDEDETTYVIYSFCLGQELFGPEVYRKPFDVEGGEGAFWQVDGLRGVYFSPLDLLMDYVEKRNKERNKDLFLHDAEQRKLYRDDYKLYVDHASVKFIQALNALDEKDNILDSFKRKCEALEEELVETRLGRDYYKGRLMEYEPDVSD